MKWKQNEQNGKVEWRAKKLGVGTSDWRNVTRKTENSAIARAAWKKIRSFGKRSIRYENLAHSLVRIDERKVILLGNIGNCGHKV